MKIIFIGAFFHLDPDGEFKWRHGGHDFTWNQALCFEFSGLTAAELNRCKELQTGTDKFREAVYTEPQKGLGFRLDKERRILRVDLNAKTAQRKFRSLDPAKIADGVDAVIKAMLSGR